MSAISADQKAGEHIALPFVGAALADLAPLLLHLLKYGPFDDRLVDVLEDDPVFPVVGEPLFVLVRLGVGLEVENVAAILLQREDVGNGGAVPHIRSAELASPRSIDALFPPIGNGGKDLFFGENRGDLLCSITVCSHTEDTAHHLGGLLVHDPPFRIVRILLIAVGRWPHRLTSVTLDFVADPALLADVAGVPLIED